MNEVDTLAKNLSAILPKKPISENTPHMQNEQKAHKKAEDLIRERLASKQRALARDQQRHQEAQVRNINDTALQQLQAEEKETAARIEAVETVDANLRVQRALNAQDKYFPQIDNLEASSVEEAEIIPASAPSSVSASASRQLAQKQLMQEFGMPTTRPEILRLLASLNVNMNMQLSKTDTANLLTCLLTCNEQQINAIYKNNKVPIAIKIVIKRLLDDLKCGSMDTVEKLWDRVFGKANMVVNLPEQTQVQGIIPNTPISREAYIVIRDTLMK